MVNSRYQNSSATGTGSVILTTYTSKKDASAIANASSVQSTYQLLMALTVVGTLFHRAFIHRHRLIILGVATGIMHALARGVAVGSIAVG